MCNIKRQSTLDRIIKECKVILLDEAPLTSKIVYEALDRTLQDICDCKKPFGGITTVFCGDFRQILPSVKRGTRSNTVSVCIKKSYLWKYFLVLKLTTNMRVRLRGDASSGIFSTILLWLGDGQVPIILHKDHTHCIGIAKPLKVVTNLTDLKNKVYPDLSTNGMDPSVPSWLSEQCILAPLNKQVTLINDELLKDFPGQLHVYNSFDSCPGDEEGVAYPVEYLNTINLSGLAKHKLSIKYGAPIIILCSLDPPNTCNGTRQLLQLSKET